MKSKVNDILICASVLSAYWEYGRFDSLDFLMPFLKYSIASTTKMNETVDVSKIKELFKSEFGYFDFPIDVVNTLLKRLSPHTLRKDGGSYTLCSSLDKEYTDYKDKQLARKERQEKVCVSLCDYLNSVIPNRKFTTSSVLDCLFIFFQQNGLFVIKNVEELNEIYFKDGRINYEIARFILDQNKNKTSVFDYLLEMVEGYFVSTAISYQNSSNSLKTKIKNLKCYLDTRIIINALGLHLPEDVTKSAKEFLEMLKICGAETYCFRHNLDEVKSILYAYRNSISNQNSYTGNTLELFDAKNYTPTDVDTYISLVEKKIINLGITIIDAPLNPDDYVSDDSFDYQGMVEVLKEKMHYNRKSIDKAADNDCKSIEAIYNLRNGDKPKELEKAKYIFVSTSNNLGTIVNNYFGYDKSQIVPIVISEIELSSWLWIRNYSTHKNFPKSQLLLNALMASEMPSPIFLENFYDKLSKLKDTGELTIEEVVTIKTDLYCKKEIFKISHGSIEEISDDSILKMKDKLKKKHQEEANNIINGLNEQLNIENSRLLNSKNKAYNEIRLAGEKRYKSIRRFGFVIASIIFVLTILAVIFLFIFRIEFPEHVNYLKIISTIFFSIIDLVCYIMFVLSAKGFVNKFIISIANNCRNKVEDKKRKEYSNILGSDLYIE